MLMLKPGKPAPALELETVTGSQWSLNDYGDSQFTMVVFYRGLFCGLCQEYLQSLVDILPEFERRQVRVLAASMDQRETAEQALRDWKLGHLAVGYGLSRADAAAWGLFLGDRTAENQEYVFNQPGLFLVQPDGNLYAGFVQSNPFARPSFKQVLNAIDFQLAEP